MSSMYAGINNRSDQYSSGYWLFHCHIEFHAEIGMSLIFKVGENEEMPPVPHNFPKCGDWKLANKKNSTTTESKNNEYLENTIKYFSVYMAYFRQFLTFYTSSASSSSITLLLFIVCLLSSVICVQTF